MNIKPICIILAAVIALGVWLTRYELVGAGSGLIVYRLDRWTSGMTAVGPEFLRKLDYEKAVSAPPQAPTNPLR